MKIQKLSVKQIDEMIMWRVDANVYQENRTTSDGKDFDEKIEEVIKCFKLSSEEKSVIGMKAHMKANEYTETDAVFGSSLRTLKQKAADAGASYAYDLAVSFMLAHRRHDRYSRIFGCGLLFFETLIGMFFLTSAMFSENKILLLFGFAISIIVMIRTAISDENQYFVSGMDAVRSIIFGGIVGAFPVIYFNMF